MCRQAGFSPGSGSKRIRKSKQTDILEAEGSTVIFVALDRKAVDVIAVSDPIKASTSRTIRILQSFGVKVIMVTDDSKKTAQTVARQLNIDAVYARVPQEEKHQQIKRLQQNGLYCFYGRGWH